jgi:hypothetical protein
VRRALRRGGIVLAVVLVVVQFVPYGHDHDNPPVTMDAPWASAQAAAIARASCYDCHSNQTDWPWYSNVAPMSFLVVKDVKQGREKVNFSEWDRPQDDADELEDSIEDGSMPPWQYTLVHRGASLTAAEKRVLLAAVRQLPGAADDDGGDGRGRGRGRGGDDD